jgi:predicted enzyme related to lactoylglutathione lyase
MLRGVEHLALCAEDVPALVDWYRKLFRVELVKEGEAGPSFLRFPDGFLLELVETTGNVPPPPRAREKGFRHIALAVSSLAAMAAELKDQGVEVVEDLKIVPGGTKLFLCRDIEGNLIQLVERTNPL